MSRRLNVRTTYVARLISPLEATFKKRDSNFLHSDLTEQTFTMVYIQTL